MHPAYTETDDQTNSSKLQLVQTLPRWYTAVVAAYGMLQDVHRTRKFIVSYSARRYPEAYMGIEDREI